MNIRLLCVLLLTPLAGLWGCGSGQLAGTSFPTPSPALTPSIASLSPPNATAGATGFTLTINGGNFVAGSTVEWRNSGNPVFFGGAATFVTASRLTFPVTAADVAIPGSVQITVVNPGKTPQSSNAATLVISPGPPGGAQRVSAGAAGVVPNGSNHDPTLSFNGRFVAFSSEATNLTVPNAKFAQAYIKDTCLGADNCIADTLLASAIDGAGTASAPVEGNALGGATPSIGLQVHGPDSSDAALAGRFIGFIAAATNLVTPATTFQQAYVRDTCFPSIAVPTCVPGTVLVSGKQSGAEPNGPAIELAFASNTCHAAFVSAATDVLPGVVIPNEIYLASCASTGATGGTGAFSTSTTLVSEGASGVPGDQGGQQPSISSDGRWVAFASASTNLTNVSSGGVQQIYLRDTCSTMPPGCVPSTALVSFDAAGNVLRGDSQVPAVSGDGRFVVFSNQEPAAGGGVTNTVLVRDMCNSTNGPISNCTPSTTSIAVTPMGDPGNGSSSSSSHAISADGRFITFASDSTNLVSPVTTGNQVFVLDTCGTSSGKITDCTPTTVLISTDETGETGGFNAAISDDGHFVAYESESAGLTAILRAATGF
jgi:hypothetical protein